MITKLNDYSLITTYIEELMHSTYVPTIKVLQDNMWVARGGVYLTPHSIVRATHTEFIRNYKDTLSNFEYIDYYEPFKKIDNLSTNYTSMTRAYNSDLHEFLGEYARAYSALYDVNIMPYYNCFSGNKAKNIQFYTEYNTSIKKYVHGIKIPDTQFDTFVEAYNYYIVPVKFGKSYMIARDYSGRIEMKVGFFYNGNYMKQITNEFDRVLDTYMMKANTCFQTPFVYDCLDNDHIANSEEFKSAFPTFYMLEGCMKLILKVAKTSSKPLVIVEGDYSKQNNNIDITQTVTNMFLNRPCRIHIGYEGFSNAYKNKDVTEKLVQIPLKLEPNHYWSNQGKYCAFSGLQATSEEHHVLVNQDIGISHQTDTYVLSALDVQSIGNATHVVYFDNDNKFLGRAYISNSDVKDVRFRVPANATRMFITSGMGKDTSFDVKLYKVETIVTSNLPSNYDIEYSNNLVKRLVSPLALFRISTDAPVAFSNRFFEYISGRIISKDDNIQENILRMQQYMSSDACLFNNKTRYIRGFIDGVYDDNIQNFIYNMAMDSFIYKNKVDYDASINKDIESLLLMGQDD